MSPPKIPDVEFVLTHAERLVKVTARCAISFGLASGLAEAAKHSSHAPDDGWSQAVYGFHGDTILMAALRLHLLLDRDGSKVSFQAVHHRLKQRAVQKGLLQALARRYGSKILPPSRADLIREFCVTYDRIDWEVHGRLQHFRNRGIAHLTPERLARSVTIAEIGSLLEIASSLAMTLQHLCQTETAFHADMQDNYSEIAKEVATKAL
jgi:hypothetical protein